MPKTELNEIVDKCYYILEEIEYLQKLERKVDDGIPLTASEIHYLIGGLDDEL